MLRKFLAGLNWRRPRGLDAELEKELRDAIAGGGLRLAYQPLVSARDESLVGVEALCRWRNPLRGEISPARFVPLAERSGLILPLGEWALRQACRDAVQWDAISVAVNVSPFQFRQRDFCETVQKVLKETGLEPRRLELELTESVLLETVEEARAMMLSLKELGVRIALDDFGCGYSSLSYLLNLPFDKLKIDRSFVEMIGARANGAAIIHAIISLGRGLGMQVTAEGVQTAEQQQFLRIAGVHTFQGYRFGRPEAASEIVARLARRAAAAEMAPTAPAALMAS